MTILATIALCLGIGIVGHDRGGDIEVRIRTGALARGADVKIGELCEITPIPSDRLLRSTASSYRPRIPCKSARPSIAWPLISKPLWCFVIPRALRSLTRWRRKCLHWTMRPGESSRPDSPEP